MIINIQHIYKLIIALQLLFFFFKIKTGNNDFLMPYFGLTIVSLMILLSQNLIRPKYFYCVTTFIILFLVLSYFGQTYPDYFSMYGLLYALSAFIMAYILYLCQNIYRFSLIIFGVYSLFLIYQFFSIGFADDELYNFVLFNSSRNFLSVIAILLSIFIGSVSIKEGRKQPLFIYLISFIFCVLLYGRSGIIVSGAILIFFYLYHRKVVTKYLVIFLGITCVAYFLDDIIYFLTNFSNFQRGVTSDRKKFILEYITNIDAYGILFGANIYECCQSIVKVDMNPHNSFIMGHARYGLAHTIFCLYMIYKTLKTKNIAIIFLMAILILRYTTDAIGLFSIYDFIIYYLLFISFNHQENKNRKLTTYNI